MVTTDNFLPKHSTTGPNMCKCSKCMREFLVADCTQVNGHHDGYEMPAYVLISCPKCKDGGLIEDFWFDEKGTATESEAMRDIRRNHIRNLTANFLNKTPALYLERDLYEFLFDLDVLHRAEVKVLQDLVHVMSSKKGGI